MFKFTFWRPRTVWWWTWYPPVYFGVGGPEQGYALELVTLVDKEEARLLPLDLDITANLEVQSHDFSVNGGEATGLFSPFEILPVSDVPARYGQLTAMMVIRMSIRECPRIVKTVSMTTVII